MALRKNKQIGRIHALVTHKKHTMKVFFITILLTLLVTTCNKNDNEDAALWKESKIELPTHTLAAFSVINNSKYLIVFESGLGDSHSVWSWKNLIQETSGLQDVLLYDRAGYGKSESGPAPRNIDKLSAELDSAIARSLNKGKVILVGHSLGGMIIRDYAVKNPEKVAALLFVDPSHELYNHPSQSDEDMIYNTLKNAYGENFGGVSEARELIEDSEYLSTISTLPDIPVVVLTSMKVQGEITAADRESWFNAHEMLKTEISDFTHITTINSGHYIMDSEPDLILTNINLLISKLPQ